MGQHQSQTCGRHSTDFTTNFFCSANIIQFHINFISFTDLQRDFSAEYHPDYRLNFIILTDSTSLSHPFPISPSQKNDTPRWPTTSTSRRFISGIAWAMWKESHMT